MFGLFLNPPKNYLVMVKRAVLLCVLVVFWVNYLGPKLSFADVYSTSAIITTVAKRAPESQKNEIASSRRVVHKESKISSTSKHRPVQKNIFRNMSASSLRRKLSSQSAIIMDAENGHILYAHDPDRKGQPASTIKVLTGLISMKSLRDTTNVKVSRRAARMPRSKIYLSRNREYKANDLINAVLISSANDASVALAEKIAGSERTFAKLMNHKAKQLGATSTVCKSASGLTVRGQRSTARDLAHIFNGAMQDEEFAERINKARVKTSYGKTLNNHNKALWRIRGAVGGKTGFTHAARQTYVGQFSRGDHTITVAIMGSETMWDDISRLVEFGFNRKIELAHSQQQKRMRELDSKRHVES